MTVQVLWAQMQESWRIFWLVPCKRWGERVPVVLKIWSFWNGHLSVAMNASHLKSVFSRASVSMQSCRADDVHYYDSPSRRKIILCKCGVVDGCLSFTAGDMSMIAVLCVFSCQDQVSEREVFSSFSSIGFCHQ